MSESNDHHVETNPLLADRPGQGRLVPGIAVSLNCKFDELSIRPRRLCGAKARPETGHGVAPRKRLTAYRRNAPIAKNLIEIITPIILLHTNATNDDNYASRCVPHRNESHHGNIAPPPHTMRCGRKPPRP